MQATIRLKLTPDKETSEVLSQTIEQYTWAFNDVCDYGWQNNIKNGVKLHDATYRHHRHVTNLPSQLVCSARVKAAEAIKSAMALKRKKKTVSVPNSKHCAIRYDARSYTVWWNEDRLSLVTIKGRVKFSFEIADYYQQYLDWKTTSADLFRDRQGKWWLHIVKQTNSPEFTATDEVTGVDLGEINPATDNRGNFYGNPEWKKIKDKTFELRRRLQSKGTKSAKRHLKKISGRQKRFRRDCDHVLAKRLVQSVNSGATIVFEDLTNIRGSAKKRKVQRRRFHSWSFKQFQNFVTYKAERKGVLVEYVDPRFTSQKCSNCGHISRSNRPSQAVFCCRQCSYSNHADINASLNIRSDYLKQRAAVNQPTVATGFLS
ncbi:MAG: RNA-guided endonuclease InsQ/TnpB family protein [Waterburya sp.]